MAAGTSIVVVAVALVATLYQFWVSPRLAIFRFGEQLQAIANDKCYGVAELQACEKIVFHDASGLLYLACSSIEARAQWVPASHLTSGPPAGSPLDYLAVFDPSTRTTAKITFPTLPHGRGVHVHGMDAVSDSHDPSKLWVYMVNHRLPLDGRDAGIVGPDSVIEIFSTHLGSKTLLHLSTVEHPIVNTPNDIAGQPDGKSFWFTNDHGTRTGFIRHLEEVIPLARGSVGYCSAPSPSGEWTCKKALGGLAGANGIAHWSSTNDTFYIAHYLGLGMRVAELSPSGAGELVLVDTIPLDRPVDNVVTDANGALWAAGWPKTRDMMKIMHDVAHLTPSSAVRITRNPGKGAYFGEKYQVDVAFEDDGQIATGATSVAYDVEHRRLFVSGLFAPQLAVCEI